MGVYLNGRVDGDKIVQLFNDADLVGVVGRSELNRGISLQPIQSFGVTQNHSGNVCIFVNGFTSTIDRKSTRLNSSHKPNS